MLVSPCTSNSQTTIHSSHQRLELSSSYYLMIWPHRLRLGPRYITQMLMMTAPSALECWNQKNGNHLQSWGMSFSHYVSSWWSQTRMTPCAATLRMYIVKTGNSSNQMSKTGLKSTVNECIRRCICNLLRVVTWWGNPIPNWAATIWRLWARLLGVSLLYALNKRCWQISRQEGATAMVLVWSSHRLLTIIQVQSLFKRMPQWISFQEWLYHPF